MWLSVSALDHLGSTQAMHRDTRQARSMVQTPHTTPPQRSALVRRSAMLATGLVVAGAAGTAALAIGIERSVAADDEGTSGSGGTVLPGSQHGSLSGGSEQDDVQAPSDGSSGSGLGVPQPGSRVDGGTNGS